MPQSRRMTTPAPKPPIKLIVSDIDGTMVRHDKSLSDANIAAVARARAAGIAVSLISARPPGGMLWIAQKLGLEGPFGAFNGATIFGSDGAIISAERMAPAAAQTALALIEAAGVSPWLFADGAWHARDLASPHIGREILSAGCQPVIGGDWSDLVTRADKLVGVCDDPERLIALEAKVKTALGSAASIARSQTYYLDILAPTGDKGHGLRQLAADFGVALEECAALGDQNNDLPMFAIAGLSVAMGQAPANVRAAADHIAVSNDDDGVADAISRFILAQ